MAPNCFSLGPRYNTGTFILRFLAAFGLTCLTSAGSFALSIGQRIARRDFVSFLPPHRKGINTGMAVLMAFLDSLPPEFAYGGITRAPPYTGNAQPCTAHSVTATPTLNRPLPERLAFRSPFLERRRSTRARLPRAANDAASNRSGTGVLLCPVRSVITPARRPVNDSASSRCRDPTSDSVTHHHPASYPRPKFAV